MPCDSALGRGEASSIDTKVAYFVSFESGACFVCAVLQHRHMKMDCDRLFGWFEMFVKRAKSLKQDIVELEDLKRVLDEQNAFFRAKDPTHPLIKVVVDRGAQKTSNIRRKLHAEDFHISKTYCISSTPVVSKAYKHGVIVKNHLYSSKPFKACLPGSDPRAVCGIQNRRRTLSVWLLPRKDPSKLGH